MPPTVAQTAPAFADAVAEATAVLSLRPNAACRVEYEDRRVLLPPLPPVAQDFVEEIYSARSVDRRALFQQLDDEWTRRTLLPAAPVVLEDWTWRLPAQAGRDFSTLCVKPLDAEPIDFARPIVTPLAYDENDWPRRFAVPYAPQTAESDVLLGIPLTPATAWLEDSANAFAGNFGSLAALLVLDDFVNAPAGGNTFGPAPGGRSTRFGFSISSFR
ncbi:MAG TPA: hypothetical protein VE263_00950 [Candidatus Angelobacter sp.]|nr:hypothetical protein [Candidatus Angelobacter sp.]